MPEKSYPSENQQIYAGKIWIIRFNKKVASLKKKSELLTNVILTASLLYIFDLNWNEYLHNRRNWRRLIQKGFNG